MAQSSSSSTIEYKNEKGVLCNCKGPARIVQAWTDDNPGRRFYSCKGRKVGAGYESCNFFRWYDLEKPSGWQHIALLEARDIIRRQKEEIKNLRDSIRAVTNEAESKMDDPSALVDDLKQSRDECETLKREVLILGERSRVFKNVMISSTAGFVLVLGFMIVMGKQ